MKKLRIFLLFLVAFLAFSSYFQREGLIGYDSYAFLNETCNDNYPHSPRNDSTPLANLLFSLLPCNILVIKIVLFLSFFASILIISKTGEYIHEEIGWLAGMFLFLSPHFAQFFLKFENEQFAVPLLFLGILYLIKADQTPERIPWMNVQQFVQSLKFMYRLIAIELFIIASMIWGGGGFIILGLGLMFWWTFFLTWPILLYYGKQLFSAVGSSGVIAENAPGLGIVSLLFLIYGFFFPVLPPLTYFLGFIAFLNGKYTILVIPLLALSMINILRLPLFEGMWRVATTVAVVMGIGLAFTSIEMAPPKEFEWQAVDYSISLHEETGKPILNEFNLGYLYDYRGYLSNNYAGYNPRWLDNIEGNIVVTVQDLPCPIRHEFGIAKVYEC